ncbi:MAG TPA: 23S rRNA (adenine(2030)-N(6))-methyltransferase RlmJ [Rhizomicrobium sp.]|jgi:23S rRNA (adenine2030-N6)-methyltransferase|nr:23S rRNA (adenine(2030)-N(6))-methyltransferase RlmJ [Rhizomicrobium sp.]
MNYRHAYHAGNFADVVKHLALTAILLHLRKKDAPFAVIDSHAGRGRYDLAGAAAQRTGEAANGIARLAGIADAAGALGAYLGLARGADYPGSPLIAASLLRPQDRLVAIEKHPEEAAALKAALARFRNAHAEEGDGYKRLAALLPPPERRGLVLIDPPFEAPDEFPAAARALAMGLKRFATGVYLLWFPIKSAGEAHAFCGAVLAAGAKQALRIDIEIGDAGKAIGGKTRLTGAGLIVVNPPYGFAAEMRAGLATIVPLLADKARADLRVLAGEAD